MKIFRYEPVDFSFPKRSKEFSSQRSARFSFFFFWFESAVEIHTPTSPFVRTKFRGKTKRFRVRVGDWPGALAVLTGRSREPTECGETTNVKFIKKESEESSRDDFIRVTQRIFRGDGGTSGARPRSSRTDRPSAAGLPSSLADVEDVAFQGEPRQWRRKNSRRTKRGLRRLRRLRIGRNGGKI